jgi:hypothetical protein
MYQIEHNVALPESFFHSSKYPFSSMSKGDSFFVPHNGDPKVKYKLRNNLYSAVHYRMIKAKKEGKNRKYIVKDLGTGFRVWQV